MKSLDFGSRRSRCSVWRSTARRVVDRFKADHVSLIAAGVAFHGLIALVPTLTAMVAVYGLVADPTDVRRRLDDLAAGLPAETRDLLDEQLGGLVSSSNASLGFAALGSILVALWGASAGTQHLLGALHRAYGEEDGQGFVAGRLQALGSTVVVVVAFVLVLGLIAALPAFAGRASATMEDVGLILRWPLVAAVMFALLLFLYRTGPDRTDPPIRWVVPGAIVALVLWSLTSMVFTAFAETFGSYGATYGSMAAVNVTLLWLLLSSLSVLLGAYVNADLEFRRKAGGGSEAPPRPVFESQSANTSRAC